MLSTTEDGSPLNLGGFTLSGRLPIKESNQFLYAVSKARPVCCNDWALTSRSKATRSLFWLVQDCVVLEKSWFCCGSIWFAKSSKDDCTQLGRNQTDAPPGELALG